MGARPLDDWSLIERARVRAVLPQDSTLSFPFTVLEVVLMGRTPHLKGVEGRVDHEIARASLDVVEARHLEQRLYPTLSGGERQRVQFARVLAQIWEPVPGSARYLLLDEPTSSLDLAHQHSSLNTARRLAHEGVGVLVILHDLNLAAQYCDDIVMLKDGRAVCAGTPSGVLTDENIFMTFGVKTLVMQHPTLKCPLVITVPPATFGAKTSEPAPARG
jgi:iron complex transport system ATP-binding protein